MSATFLESSRFLFERSLSKASTLKLKLVGSAPKSSRSQDPLLVKVAQFLGGDSAGATKNNEIESPTRRTGHIPSILETNMLLKIKVKRRNIIKSSSAPTCDEKSDLKIWIRLYSWWNHPETHPISHIHPLWEPLREPPVVSRPAFAEHRTTLAWFYCEGKIKPLFPNSTLLTESQRLSYISTLAWFSTQPKKAQYILHWATSITSYILPHLPDRWNIQCHGTLHVVNLSSAQRTELQSKRYPLGQLKA